MKFVIEKRYSKDTLLEGKAENLVKFIQNNKNDLSGSNLSGSDLSGSNLSGSNLVRVKIKANQKEQLLRSLKIEIKED